MKKQRKAGNKKKSLKAAAARKKTVKKRLSNELNFITLTKKQVEAGRPKDAYDYVM